MKEYEYNIRFVGMYNQYEEQTPVTGIELTPNEKELEVEDTYMVEAKVLPESATNKGINWSSSDEAIVSVDQYGKIKAIKEGRASIKGTTSDGKLEANCDITVIPEKLSGTYGTVPWVWEAKSRTLTFLDGEFPPSSSNTNILKAIQNDPRLNEETIKTITFTKKVVGHLNSSYLFGYLPNLETINELELLDTSQVTNMDHMFHNTKSLTNVDVGGWNTTKVTNMISMFQDARSLISLDVGGWNTKQVTNMQSMFDNARSLTNLNVKNWNTSKVILMDWMFAGASNLTSLDIRSWETLKVTDMSLMFNGTVKLDTIHLGSNFKFLKNNYLPEKKGTPYTGKWVNKENSSIVMESSNDFAARYDGTQPGTYIREELKE